MRCWKWRSSVQRSRLRADLGQTTARLPRGVFHGDPAEASGVALRSRGRAKLRHGRDVDRVVGGLAARSFSDTPHVIVLAPATLILLRNLVRTLPLGVGVRSLAAGPKKSPPVETELVEILIDA